MTPTIDHGLLFVGTHNPPSTFVALNTTNGALVWSKQFPGLMRSTPVAANGYVYQGESGGDPPACVQGGLFEMNELTGADGWSWTTMPLPNQGGAVWTPISYDGSTFYVGTGNTCTTVSTPPGNSIVHLNAGGQFQWGSNAADTTYDDDFGGGVLLMHGEAIATNKNGVLYDLDAGSGGLIWSSHLGPVAGYGSIGTPTSDGRIIAASGGYASEPQADGSGQGLLFGLNTSGRIVWTRNTTQRPITSYVAINNGIGYATLDNQIVALDLLTGATLWSYTTKNVIAGGAVVVPSGVYVTDSGGNTYAFCLPSTTCAPAPAYELQSALRARVIPQTTESSGQLRPYRK